jgi:tRNA-specific 2-thiouridylase
VAGKDRDTNVLYVVQGGNHPALFRPALQASHVHWIAGAPPGVAFACTARIRHQQPVQACHVYGDGDTDCRVQFEQPQRAIAAGQSVVFYNGDECLGGAVIERALDHL